MTRKELLIQEAARYIGRSQRQNLNEMFGFGKEKETPSVTSDLSNVISNEVDKGNLNPDLTPVKYNVGGKVYTGINHGHVEKHVEHVEDDFGNLITAHERKATARGREYVHPADQQKQIHNDVERFHAALPSSIPKEHAAAIASHVRKTLEDHHYNTVGPHFSQFTGRFTTAPPRNFYD